TSGISEYIKKVWEESKYIKPPEITGKFANNSLINVARRVQSTEMKPFRRFVRENGVWWIGTGENRRRDNEIEAPIEEEHEEEEVRMQILIGRSVIDEVMSSGESGSDDRFFDAQVDVEEPSDEAPTAQAFPTSQGDSTNQRRSKHQQELIPRVHL
ncbi:hypothetical protein Dimus_022916, partial [Dionaea muscipula]